MQWSDDFIAVDWGTTNRRAYKMMDGACVDEFEDDRGALSIAADGFPAAAEEIRQRLGDAPLLMAGMVGSTRGWVEVPYVACPAGLDEVAARVHWVEAGRVAIVPGLSIRNTTEADVMRGEEVQIFGAVASGAVPANGVVCHPGTHCKWVRIVDGRVTTFRTVLTGEMFGLLRAHGILSEMLVGDVTTGDAFRSGVQRGLQSPVLTAELFSIRAGVLLGVIERPDAPSFLSGLLIGADLAVGLALGDETPLNIVGEPELTRLYAAAAQGTGREIREIEGRDAFLAGVVALARKLK